MVHKLLFVSEMIRTKDFTSWRKVETVVINEEYFFLSLDLSIGNTLNLAQVRWCDGNSYRKFGGILRDLRRYKGDLCSLFVCKESADKLYAHSGIPKGMRNCNNCCWSWTRRAQSFSMCVHFTYIYI